MNAAEVPWTAEQLEAIERRTGDFFLDAGAGSGKTAVLVERFVRAVLEDGVDVGAILTITFTEKAAAEMRERIRRRLHELGAHEEARQTERAFISTIHGFCARVLRAGALAAGIDPRFSVLDEVRAAALAQRAFDDALQRLAEDSEAVRELVASYGMWDLRATVLSVHEQLRSRGQLVPRLPPLPPAGEPAGARDRVLTAARVVAAELRAVEEPSIRVLDALERLERVEDRLAGGALAWPGELDALKLPGGNGAALSTPACLEYADALSALRGCLAAIWSQRIHPALDALLAAFGSLYAQRKREDSGLDFADLELLCVKLLRSEAELRERYRLRFERVMVDELQDTNAVQLELIDLVSRDNLFTVGDAQQSIYAFRHADVELFKARGERLARSGERASLTVNFRARQELLGVVNRAFAGELSDGFMELATGRQDPPAGEPRVELLIVDREAEWSSDELAIAWRLAEARALGSRIAELLAGGAAPRDVVVLTRATTDMRLYERALEERGIPTYVIGGRGYWSHPQVIDMLAYLRVLANPRDEEALYTVLVSPLVGISYDTLVLLAAAARAGDRDPWWVIRDPGDALDALDPEDRRRLLEFASWAAGERVAAGRAGADALIERALDATGYDLAVLAMPGGQRRLANVRKLMRLARGAGQTKGSDLRAFLELVAERSGPAARGAAQESEAPVEGEALDAVRLMTIHGAKGLEFEIVCVADLGRSPWRDAPVVRIGADGRLGLRLARPGTGAREPALAYDVLSEEQRQAQEREERRLFYVAATRARERLVFSGAARIQEGVLLSGAPIGWLAPALVPDLTARLQRGELDGPSDGVRYSVLLPEHPATEPPDLGDGSPSPSVLAENPVPSHAASPSVPLPRALSYTALAEYSRCGYRYYVQRVLGLPPVEVPGAPSDLSAGAGASALSGVERGTILHALLERLDFRRPVAPGPEAVAAAAGRSLSPESVRELTELVETFATSRLSARLAQADRVHREQPFGFLLDETLITGVFDVIATTHDGDALVVDYKSDRLEGGDPVALVGERYATQRLVYALAALRSGAERVEVAHVFLERPEQPISVAYERSGLLALERELRALVAGVVAGRFAVSDTPHRGLCSECPAEGGLCSWPLSMTRRDAPDRLF